MGDQWGQGDGSIKRELKVEGFSVLFLEFSLKIKIFVYSANEGGPELIERVGSGPFWVQASSFGFHSCSRSHICSISGSAFSSGESGSLQSCSQTKHPHYFSRKNKSMEHALMPTSPPLKTFISK